jgi:hypothetical protein
MKAPVLSDQSIREEPVSRLLDNLRHTIKRLAARRNVIVVQVSVIILPPWRSL